MRPIDAEALEKEVLKPSMFDINKDDVIALIAEIPTLDVVHREEVDRLRHILNSYALQYGTVKDQQEVIDRIKQETAREIFEEIEPRFAIGEFTGSDVFYAIRAEDYNRCKKKYTEDSTDGKRTDR